VGVSARPAPATRAAIVSGDKAMITIHPASVGWLDATNAHGSSHSTLIAMIVTVTRL
jgi:hypothetical protein